MLTLRICCDCGGEHRVERGTSDCPSCGSNFDQARARALVAGQKRNKVVKYDRPEDIGEVK